MLATFDPSDYFLVIDLALALIFLGYFSLGHPRVWYRDRLGWVIMSYALAVVALLCLIVYSIVFGQRVDEVVRSAVALTLGAALLAKTWSMRQERRGARAPLTNPLPKNGVLPMTNRTPGRHAAIAAAKVELAPWYPVQRVMRSVIGALVVLVPLLNGLFIAAAEYLKVQEDVVVSPGFFLALNAAIATTSLVIGLVARLMAVPGVNAWLTRFGLGAAPKSSIVVDSLGTVAVAPDFGTTR